MASSLARVPVINHDASTGGVNLLQVAGYVKGGNARRHATASMTVLGMAARPDMKIRGIGKDVLVGTYEEALKIAEHLGANDEKLAGIKEALKALMRLEDAETAPTENAPGVLATDGGNKLFTVVMTSDDAFPIVFDETWSRLLGYKRHKDANDIVQRLINRSVLCLEVHVAKEKYFNLNNGQCLWKYKFSMQGFKIFVSQCRTEMATRISSELAAHADAELFLKSLMRKRDKIESRAIEAEVRDRLAGKLMGRTEVRCSHGRVDILTETHVIEVKKASFYKQAIGQVLVYRNKCFPLKECRVHLFATEFQMKTIKKAQDACDGLDIELTYEIVRLNSNLHLF